MKITENRKRYIKEYQIHMLDDDMPIHYIARNGDDTRYFKTRQELADFFGYCETSITKVLKKTNPLYGWTVERYKWFEHLKDKKK